MSITQQQVMEALRAVSDPDLGRDIVSLGFVKDVRIAGDQVTFTIELTTPACPVRDQMKTEAERRVAALPGVASARATMTARVRAAGATIDVEPIPGVRNVVAVGAGKGGVGKTTTAVNLALALAAEGARVGLLDGDVYGPNVPQMLGIADPPEIDEDRKLHPSEAHGIKVISMGLLVPSDQAVIWRGPMLHTAVRQFLRESVWGELDYLFVDLPPGTGDVSLSMAQSVPIAGAVIVTTPQEVAVADVRKAVTMFRQLRIPVLGVVENMSYYVCNHCGERTDVFGHGGGRRMAEQLDLPILGEVPLDPTLSSGGDEGRPVVIAAPLTSAGRAFSEAARRVAAEISIRAQNVAATHDGASAAARES